MQRFDLEIHLIVYKFLCQLVQGFFGFWVHKVKLASLPKVKLL